jgi:hypothetical protein
MLKFLKKNKIYLLIILIILIISVFFYKNKSYETFNIGDASFFNNYIGSGPSGFILGTGNYPTLSGSQNDKISSINPKIHTVTAYEHSNYNGKSFTLQPNSGRVNVPSGFNDKISSIKVS